MEAPLEDENPKTYAAYIKSRPTERMIHVAMVFVCLIYLAFGVLGYLICGRGGMASDILLSPMLFGGGNATETASVSAVTAYDTDTDAARLHMPIGAPLVPMNGTGATFLLARAWNGSPIVEEQGGFRDIIAPRGPDGAGFDSSFGYLRIGVLLIALTNLLRLPLMLLPLRLVLNSLVHDLVRGNGGGGTAGKSESVIDGGGSWARFRDTVGALCPLVRWYPIAVEMLLLNGIMAGMAWKVEKFWGKNWLQGQRVSTKKVWCCRVGWYCCTDDLVWVWLWIEFYLFLGAGFAFIPPIKLKSLAVPLTILSFTAIPFISFIVPGAISLAAAAHRRRGEMKYNVLGRRLLADEGRHTTSGAGVEVVLETSADPFARSRGWVLVVFGIFSAVGILVTTLVTMWI